MEDEFEVYMSDADEAYSDSYNVIYNKAGDIALVSENGKAFTMSPAHAAILAVKLKNASLEVADTIKEMLQGS